MQRSLRTRAVTRGLAPTEPTDNVLVAYAARDGTTANDGDGKNSPFTTALLHNIETPGLEISFLFRNVRDEVMAATKREQQPFVYGSLSKEAIYLKPVPVNASPMAPAAAAPAEDEQFWQAIKTSSVPGLYEEFLTRYPKSSHIFEARERLVDLRSKQVAATPQAAASLSPTVARNMFTPEDAQRVATMGTDLQLIVPPFKMGETRSDVPLTYQRFVGIWSNRIRWGHGKGRLDMLIVTEVQSDGLARGYSLWGPPTKFSWVNSPAGYIPFAETISGDTLSLKTGTTVTIDAKVVGQNAMALRSTYRQAGKEPKTSSAQFNPVWQLVPPDQEVLKKRPSDRLEGTLATRKRAAEISIPSDERKTNPPKPQNSKDSTQALYAQCSAEGHRLTGSKHTNVGFSRIEACARNGGKM
jgi:hypothetical protein